MAFVQIIAIAIGTIIGRMFWDIFQDKRRRRAEARFIKLISVTFPDQDSITYISVDSSDRVAFRNLVKQLREEFNVPEDQLNPIFRRTARRKSENPPKTRR